MGLDTDFNIYPCHRLVSVPEREQYQLGNVFDTKTFKNYEFFNQFFHNSKTHKVMYSSVMNNYGFKDNIYMFNWCPSTNLQTSGSIYYQNPKYNLMHKELNRLIDMLFDKYMLYNIDVKCNGQCNPR